MFSNSIEFEPFHERCMECIHFPQNQNDGNCPLLAAIQTLGYTQDHGRLEVFDMLIGKYPHKCKMFLERKRYENSHPHSD